MVLDVAMMTTSIMTRLATKDRRVLADGSERLTRDEVLDNITLAWLSNTVSPAQVSIGRTTVRRFFAIEVTVPTDLSRLSRH